MTCDSARILLQSSFDRALPPQERTALNTHLQGCAACRTEQDAQRRLARLTGCWAARAVELSDPGEDFTVQVLSRLERPAHWERSASSRLRAWLPLAALLLLLGLLPLVPGVHSLRVGLPMPSLLAVPGWLDANMTALPGAARAALWLPQATSVPSWTTLALFGVLLLNAGFYAHARQRSAS